MTDFLADMLATQENFQRMHKYAPRLKDISMAIAAEAMELWEGSGGKWWKNYTDNSNSFNQRWGHMGADEAEEYLRMIEVINEQANKKEIIDLFHFVLEACVAYGMSSTEIHAIYSAKMAENKERQRTGY